MVSMKQWILDAAWRVRNVLKIDRTYVSLLGKIMFSAPKRRHALAAYVNGPHFVSTGWADSFCAGTPIDAAGNPLPWLSYTAIRLLEKKLPPEISVLEFGAGNSTLWWAKRATSVLTIESSRIWYDRVCIRIPDNVDLRHVPGGSLPDLLDTLIAEGRKYDIIVIDNLDRGTVSVRTPKLLSQNGVVIFDNSDEPLYRPSVEKILSAGFREIELYSEGPINPFPWSTSLLYRDGNLLNI